MAFRDEDAALAARGDALRTELRMRESLDLALELVHVEHRRRERRLRSIDRLRIASPCEASWEAMEGDGPVRRCHRCEKDVYDVAGLSSDAVLALLERFNERPCVRLHRRADGTVITGDCPEGRRRHDRRGLALAGGLLLNAAGFAVAAGPSIDTAYEQPSPNELHTTPLMGAAIWEPEGKPDCETTFDENTFLHGWQDDPPDD